MWGVGGVAASPQPSLTPPICPPKRPRFWLQGRGPLVGQTGPLPRPNLGGAGDVLGGGGASGGFSAFFPTKCFLRHAGLFWGVGFFGVGARMGPHPGSSNQCGAPVAEISFISSVSIVFCPTPPQKGSLPSAPPVAAPGAKHSRGLARNTGVVLEGRVLVSLVGMEGKFPPPSHWEGVCTSPGGPFTYALCSNGHL